MKEHSVLRECHDIAQGKRIIARNRAEQKYSRIHDERSLNIELSKTRTELKKLSDKYLEKTNDEKAILKRLKQLKKKDFVQLTLL